MLERKAFILIQGGAQSADQGWSVGRGCNLVQEPGAKLEKKSRKYRCQKKYYQAKFQSMQQYLVSVCEEIEETYKR